MNPVLILSHNCLDLTKRCVESVAAQDIETEVMLIDNGSTDGTADWFDTTINLDGFAWKENRGVSAGWNYGIHTIFAEDDEAEHILVLNNDTQLPPYFYRALLSLNLPFVTGISCDDSEIIHSPMPPFHLGAGPDFSAFLIRRDAWTTVGPFDERMKHYASDCDWAVRAHRAGVELPNSGLPFYHERSSTLNHASPFDRRLIENQADKDRAVFKSLYGCDVWSPQYAELFK